MSLFRSLRRRSSRLSHSRRNDLAAPQLVERLETRQLLVGQVTAAVRGDHLFLTGDESSNQLEISVSNGNVAVRPKNGTRINGQRGQFIAFADTDTVPGRIVINLRQGDDTVVLARGLKVQDDVRFYGHQGNDTLGLDNVIIRDDLLFLGGTGDDSISIEDSRVVADATLKLNQGDDLVRIVKSDFRDDLRVRGSQGDDSVVIDDVDIRADARLRLQRGDDIVDMRNTRVDGHVRIKTQSGLDAVLIDDSVFAGRSSISLGSDNDDLALGNGDGSDTTPASGNVFKSGIRLIGGGGQDALEVDIDNDFRGRRREIGFENTDAADGITDGAVTDADNLRNTVLDLIGVNRDLSANIDTVAGSVFQSGDADQSIFVTNQETVTITGVADSGATIDVDSNADGIFDDASAFVDAGGRYTVTVPVDPGQHTIDVRSTDERDNTENVQVEVHRAVGTVVRMTSGQGDIDIELLDADAPITVANFRNYFDRYDGNSIIHRSITDFVIQGGGFTVDADTVTAVPTDPPIVNEFNAANSNLRGTLSMALVGGDINSGTSQWFINVVDNTNLDNARHTVFGNVIGGPDGPGMQVADAINNLSTFDVSLVTRLSALTDVPLENFQEQTDLTGSVSIALGSFTVSGNGTRFTSELAVGDRITIGTQQFIVNTIGADDDLTVNVAATQNFTNVTATRDTKPTEDNFVVFSNIEALLEQI